MESRRGGRAGIHLHLVFKPLQVLPHILFIPPSHAQAGTSTARGHEKLWGRRNKIWGNEGEEIRYGGMCGEEKDIGKYDGGRNKIWGNMRERIKERKGIRGGSMGRIKQRGAASAVAPMTPFTHSIYKRRSPIAPTRAPDPSAACGRTARGRMCGATRSPGRGGRSARAASGREGGGQYG